MKVIKGNKVILNQNNSWMKDPTIKFAKRSHSKYGIRHYVYSINGSIQQLEDLRNYLKKYKIPHRYTSSFMENGSIEIEAEYTYINK
jgi:predicted glycosyl hydrolase (DUF1957 family)